MEPVSRQRRGTALRVMPGDGAKGPTDEEIMAAVLAGDARVADQIYARLYDTVDRTLYRIFGRREQDHEDLVLGNKPGRFQRASLTTSGTQSV
jgi:hypothetical protein